MKHYKSIDSPKTISQLKSNKRKLQSELDKLTGESRTTRLQSAFKHSNNRKTIEQIKNKIRNIDLILEQRNQPKVDVEQLSLNIDDMTLEHTPQKSTNTQTPEDQNAQPSERNPNAQTGAAGGLQTPFEPFVPPSTTSNIRPPSSPHLFDSHQDAFAFGGVKKKHTGFNLGTNDGDETRFSANKDRFGDGAYNFPMNPNKFDPYGNDLLSSSNFSNPKPQKSPKPKSKWQHASTDFTLPKSKEELRKPGPSREAQLQDLLESTLHNISQTQQQNLIDDLNNDDEETHNRTSRSRSSSRPREKPRDSYARRLRLIPVFDGETYKSLRDFLDVAGALNDSWTNDTEKTELIETLSLQLRGEARNVVGNLFESDFDEMKKKLLKHFDYLMNREVVTSQLENLRQTAKETIVEFAERARKTLKEKCNTYSYLSEDHKNEYDRVARRAFTQGVRDPDLKRQLFNRRSDKLEDAIAFAIEADFDSANTVANSELFCTYCKNVGHRARDCRRKESNASGVGQLVSLLRGFSYNNGNRNSQGVANFRGRGGRWNNSRGNFNNNNRGNGQRNWNNGSRNWNNSGSESNSNANSNTNSNSGDNQSRNNSWRNNNNQRQYNQQNNNRDNNRQNRNNQNSGGAFQYPMQTNDQTSSSSRTTTSESEN